LVLNEPLTATRSIGSSTGERVAGARVNGVWIRPDLLATMKTGDLGSVLVLRGELSVGGKPYQAVSLVDPTAGAYSFFAYDSVTGVQLLSALRTTTITGGPVEMSLTELRGVRQLTVPGIGAAVPDWVARHPELVYAGIQEFVNPMDPSSAPITSSVSWRTRLAQSGATWAMFETNGTVDMMGSSIPISSSGVIGGAGPDWLGTPPRSLACRLGRSSTPTPGPASPSPLPRSARARMGRRSSSACRCPVSRARPTTTWALA